MPTDLPDGVEVFSCSTIPGCGHAGRYACTPRQEVPVCTGVAISKADMGVRVASRGACKRECHFRPQCGAYHWDPHGSRCDMCLEASSFGSSVHRWWFEDTTLADHRIVEWHHGWHSGSVQSVSHACIVNDQTVTHPGWTRIRTRGRSRCRVPQGCSLPT